MIKKLLIYGAGVIGSLYAALFGEAGYDVTIYARGRRLELLESKGLLYLQKGKIKRADVKIISKLLDDDIYDFVFRSVRENQLYGALEELKTNKSTCIVTLVNSIDDYGKWENICGKARILPAFPGAGGSIKEDILDAGLTPGVVQPTTFAEISGKITGRVKKLSKLMKKSRIPYQVAGDMHKWQLCHLAMVVPIADAYYVEGSHDAIIEPAEWQLVQTEIQRRKNTGRSHNCCSPFSAKLKCGDCGEYFGSKVWHSNSKYKRTVWQCNAKFKGESRCATPHLYEQRIKELFLEALGILMADRETVIADCRAVMEALADCGPIDAEMEAVSDEMEVTAGLIQKLVDENATRKLDQHDYRKKYDGYASRYAALESRMDSLEKERERKEIQYDLFSGFLAGLGETEELPVDFNEKLFHRLVDYATVYPDGRVVFTFRNGVEVSTEI